MNIIDLQERLKDLPETALMQEMQTPSGTAPQFLVLSELKRRKRMRDEYQRQQAQGMQTVAEEAITAAGMPQQGIMGLAQGMAPRSAIAQDTGVNDMMQQESVRAPQPEQPMMMADGGYVHRMQEGGFAGTQQQGYLIFLDSMGLQDSPESRDMYIRMMERQEERGVSPSIFMPGMDRAPDEVSLSDVSTDIGAFMPGAEARPQMMTAPPALGAAPSAGTIDFDASITEAPSAPPPMPDTLTGSDLMRAAAEFSGPSEQSRAALALGSEDVLRPFGGAGEEISPSVGDLEYGGLTDPRVVTQGERPEFLGDVLSYLRSLSAEARPQIGGYEFSPKELEAMSSVPAATQGARDDLASESADSGDKGLSFGLDGLNIPGSGTPLSFGGVTPSAADIPLSTGVEPSGEPTPEFPLGTPVPGAQPVADRSGGGTGGGGGGGGFGSIESRIARMLEEREKSAEADKWLSLAQTGLALMASDQPTLGGAIGEAGLAGIGAMQKARSQYDKDIMSLLDMQAGFQRARASGARARQPKPRTAAELNAALDFFEGEVERLAKPIYGPDPSDPMGMKQTIVGYDYSSVPADVMNDFISLRDQYKQMFQSPVDVTS